MLSYLQAVQKLTDETIYTRGLKFYLEGRIISHKNLTLDYWREYQLVDSDIYTIRIPLLHLALSKEKYNFAHLAIEELVTCDCAYFFEYGICKHVVAVCASLENEFNFELKTKKKQANQKEQEKILDSIFVAENQRKFREFEINLEEYLQTSNRNNLDWLERFASQTKEENQENQKYLKSLEKFFSQKLEIYENEKKILNLIWPSLRVGKKIWWDLWAKLFKKFTQDKQIQIWAKIWLMRVAGNLEDIQKDLQLKIRSLDLQKKQTIFFNLQKEYPEQTTIWLEFGLTAELWDWFLENIENLDPQTLIKLGTLIPDYREDIDREISIKIKIWSDFLETGQNYEEIIETFRSWRKSLGENEFMDFAWEYIKDSHAKKKKLLKEIKKVLEE